MKNETPNSVQPLISASEIQTLNVLKDVMIDDELTEFDVASPATAWWIPAGEWNRYEYLYNKTPLAEVGQTHTPITIRTEAGLHVTYCILTDGDAGGFEEDPLDAAWSECYSEIEPADATDCFATVSAAGGPDLPMMPIQLRFPECGYIQSWDNDFYQLPDAEFIGAAEAARPCFLDLVAQGAVDEWELPPEIADLECFEGRNWYQVLDDPDYDARYYECLDQSNG